MYNCYCIILAGRPFAYFKTEMACENFMRVMNERTSKPYEFTIEGKYVEGIDF